MKYFYKISLTLFLISSLGICASAQKFIPDEATESTGKKVEKTAKKEGVGKSEKKEKVNEKVKQLEAQVKAMRAELDALKKSLAREKTSKTSNTVAQSSIVEKVPGGKKAAVPVAATTTSAPKKDLSVDVGKYRITPYGIIFFNAFANSSGTNNTDDPLWATPNPSGNSGASARQTRLGVRITGGKLGNANVTGVVEADFYGGFPGVGVGENMGVIRLRVAKAQFDWERTRMIVGQDWMLFAPNSPTSLAAAAIPQFAAAGNPWARLPQFRVEQKLGKHFKWQGAVLAPGTGDFPRGGATPTLLQPSSGSASKMPFLQSRFSYSNGNWFGTKGAGSIGVAGHFGRSRVSNAFVADDINSYGVAVDWNFPIVKRVTAKGEAFLGENLGGFQAGIFQGYNTDFDGGGMTPGVRGIRTQGGWIQLGWNLPTLDDRLTLYASTGIDDPRNLDLISLSNRNFRTRNFGYAFDAIYKINKQLSFGAEFRRLQTMYVQSGERSSNHINLAGKYSF